MNKKSINVNKDLELLRSNEYTEKDQSSFDKQNLSYIINFLININKFINFKSKLDIQDIEILSKLNNYQLNSIIEVRPTSTLQFSLQFKCPRCKEIFWSKCNRLTLIHHIKNIKDIGIGFFLCNKCFDFLEVENERIRELNSKKRDIEFEKIVKNNTYHFIHIFLNPVNKEKYNFYKLSSYSINKEEVCSYIRQMDYSDFLKTPYWKSISSYVKKRDNYKCKLCTNKTNLNVHHSTYEILGREIGNTNKLICLCQTCHSKFHDK